MPANESLPKAQIRVSVQIPFQLPDGSIAPARAYAFDGFGDGREHVAFGFGSVEKKTSPLVRLHSECLTGDVFGSQRCDCGPQLHESLQRLTKEGVVSKLEAYALQDEGLDTFEANEALGLARDARDYLVAAQMLHALEVTDVRLISNNPEKEEQLARYGIRVRERIPTGVFVTDANRRYLEAKAGVGGHRFRVDQPAVETRRN